MASSKVLEEKLTNYPLLPGKKGLKRALKKYSPKYLDSILEFVQDFELVPAFMITPELARIIADSYALRCQDLTKKVESEECANMLRLVYERNHHWRAALHRGTVDLPGLLFVDQCVQDQ